MFGGTIVGLLSAWSELFPATANPIVSRTIGGALLAIALSTLQGALVGSVYGLVLVRSDANRLLIHLYAGPLAVIVWIAARSLVDGGNLLLLVSPVGAAFVVIGGTILGVCVWFTIRFKRSGSAA